MMYRGGIATIAPLTIAAHRGSSFSQFRNARRPVTPDLLSVFTFSSSIGVSSTVLHLFPGRPACRVDSELRRGNMRSLLLREFTPICDRKTKSILPHWDRHASHIENNQSTRLNSIHLGISYAVFCL